MNLDGVGRRIALNADLREWKKLEKFQTYTPRRWQDN